MPSSIIKDNIFLLHENVGFKMVQTLFVEVLRFSDFKYGVVVLTNL